jgi:hypothetical protein
LFRRAYSHVQDAGQRRCFFVKFVGEGVDDNGGPYRAAVQAAAAEEPAGPLGMLVPCPNAESKVASNWDKVVFAPALAEEGAPGAATASAANVPTSSGMDGPASAAATGTAIPIPTTNLPAAVPVGPPSQRALSDFRFLGCLAGMAVRNGVLLPLNLPSSVWRPLTGLPVRHADLAVIDTATADALDAVMAVLPEAPPRVPLPASGSLKEDESEADEAATHAGGESGVPASATAPSSSPAPGPSSSEDAWDSEPQYGLPELRRRAAAAVEVLGRYAPKHAAAAANAVDFDSRSAFVSV